MSLTTAQQAAIAADIVANNTLAEHPVGSGQQVAVKNIPKNSEGANSVAAFYNLFPATNFFGNYHAVPLPSIKGAISWKNLTPTDSPDGTQQWANRSLACQGFQFNLQMLLTPAGGSNTIDATQRSVWQGLKDALTLVPSGVSGATQSAGWAAVQVVLCRQGTNAEKVFADLTNGTGADNTHAASFTFEGQVSINDIEALPIWGA